MDPNKGETIQNPGVTYDSDMRLTEAVAAVVFMHEEREKLGFGKPDEIDFASFSKHWKDMGKDERDKFAQNLAHLAGRAAAGPGPSTGVPLNESPLDHAAALAEEKGFESIYAGLAVVVAGAGTKKKDEDIAPDTREHFTTSQKNPDGSESTVTVPIPQYDPGEVKGILTKISQLTLSPAPAPVSSPHP